MWISVAMETSTHPYSKCIAMATLIHCNVWSLNALPDQTMAPIIELIASYTHRPGETTVIDIKEVLKTL